jgi:asparagine synthase (glutamine-hydrolysing)
VLTGEGGDEMFGGYQRYALWRKLKCQELGSRWAPAELLPRTWPFLGVRRFAGRDAAVYASVYHDFPAMHRLFPALVPKPGAREAASARFSDFRDRMFGADQLGYLESLLVRQDKMSMASSVEARVPYVHLPLARVLNALPREVRVPGRVTKPLLKRIAEPYLRRDLLYRRKEGLRLPYNDWLMDGEGLGRYLEFLAAPDCRLRQYARPRMLTKVVDAFRAGKRKGLPSMMYLINVELWLRSLPAGASR